MWLGGWEVEEDWWLRKTNNLRSVLRTLAPNKEGLIERTLCYLN
jgi:hypothetical protein